MNVRNNYDENNAFNDSLQTELLQLTYKSSAVVEKRRHAECALVYGHLWPRSIQPHAKIIVVCSHVVHGAIS